MFWLTTGVLGILGFLGVLGYVIWLGLKNPNPLKNIVLAGLAVIILQGLVDTPYFKNDLSVLFWLVLGNMLILNKGQIE